MLKKTYPLKNVLRVTGLSSGGKNGNYAGTQLNIVQNAIKIKGLTRYEKYLLV